MLAERWVWLTEGILGPERGAAARPREGRAQGQERNPRAWKTKVRGQEAGELGRWLGCQGKAKLVQAEVTQNLVPNPALGCSLHTPSAAVPGNGSPGTFGQS